MMLYNELAACACHQKMLDGDHGKRSHLFSLNIFLIQASFNSSKQIIVCKRFA